MIHCRHIHAWHKWFSKLSYYAIFVKITFQISDLEKVCQGRRQSGQKLSTCMRAKISTFKSSLLLLVTFHDRRTTDGRLPYNGRLPIQSTTA